MTTLSFETIRNAWNRVRVSDAQKFKKAAPGLVDLSKVMVRRIGETVDAVTIEFKGFEQAVLNAAQDVPLVKRAIQQWLRGLTDVQIGRGDPNSLTLRVSKMIRQVPSGANLNAVPKRPDKYERPRSSNLASITAMRKVG